MPPELKRIPVSEELTDYIDCASYDGYPVTPYVALECPFCGGEAFAVHCYLGGYQRHCALRCSECDGTCPLIAPSKSSPAWLSGHYVHYNLQYDIAPAIIVRQKIGAVTFSEELAA